MPHVERIRAEFDAEFMQQFVLVELVGELQARKTRDKQKFGCMSSYTVAAWCISSTVTFYVQFVF